MIEFFYSLKFSIGCNKLCSAWNKLVSFCFNLLYPSYCKRHPISDGLNHETRKEPIIISLTSFPQRFRTLPFSIYSLLNQTMKPDKVILWLTEEECSNLTLPDSLIQLCKVGLEIHFVKENLKPHNKLYYALQDYPDAVIISVDDDIIYHPQLVERLFIAHEKNPGCVCCNMAHEITLNNGKPDLYDNWNGGSIGKDGVSPYFVALGVGGVLYPPHCFDEEYFNTSLIKSLALSADDLWLKFAELRMNIPVRKIYPNSKIPFTIRGSQTVALGKMNNGAHCNDLIMKKLCDYYDINWNQI